MNKYRIGFGFDVHRFSKRKKALILGGIKIPYPFGLKAVSDGDVVLHAISDALCGFSCLGDIGDYFPPAKQYAGIDSKKIAAFIVNKIVKRFKIINIDVTIVAQRPRLIPYKKRMTGSLKRIFSTPDINIKIKSKEGLDILGGKSAIACFVIVLAKRILP